MNVIVVPGATEHDGEHVKEALGTASAACVATRARMVTRAEEGQSPAST